jgi:UDP-3-O-acyl-N-acetylglucosamine deacetylase
MMRQRTLKAVAKTVGVGVHSGQRVDLVLRPAAPNTGIVFRRVDFDPPVDVLASPLRVFDTTMATTLTAIEQRDGKDVKVATVEHLLGLELIIFLLMLVRPKSQSSTAPLAPSCFSFSLWVWWSNPR